MALTDEDREEIKEIIRTEIRRVSEETAKEFRNSFPQDYLKQLNPTELVKVVLTSINRATEE